MAYELQAFRCVIESICSLLNADAEAFYDHVSVRTDLTNPELDSNVRYGQYLRCCYWSIGSFVRYSNYNMSPTDVAVISVCMQLIDAFCEKYGE